MVEEMRKVIRASWIVSITYERGEQCKIYGSGVLQSVKGPVRGLLWLRTQGDEAHIY